MIGIFTFWLIVITDCISIINKIMLNIVACLPTYLSERHRFVQLKSVSAIDCSFELLRLLLFLSRLNGKCPSKL